MTSTKRKLEFDRYIYNQKMFSNTNKLSYSLIIKVIPMNEKKNKFI